MEVASIVSKKEATVDPRKFYETVENFKHLHYLSNFLFFLFLNGMQHEHDL
jgi:hypothetical protein